MPVEYFERRTLQAAILICGMVPVLAGGSGAFFGTDLLDTTVNVAFDSHFRYLSALLLGIGFAFWSCIPNIETKETRARTLTAIVFLGGLVRLGAAIVVEWPPLAMTLAIGMEVIVTPLLYFWLRRVARQTLGAGGGAAAVGAADV